MSNTNASVVTYRENVKLPSMPSEMGSLQNLPIIDLPSGEMIRSRLVFSSPSDFLSALKLGFFLVKIPDYIDLTPGDLFVNSFFKSKASSMSIENNQYRGFKNVHLSESYQGYFDREFDQWENFYIEEANWEKYLPKELCLLGKQIAELGINILRSVLSYLQIPEYLWFQITSGLSEKKGHQMFAFNHFRSGKLVRGSKFHRDSGWVTVLRSFEPGLVALIDSILYAINPKPGHFIINFGSSIEVLTAKLDIPARANIHGVAQTVRTESQPDRVSYTMFLDSDLSGNIYQLDAIDKPRIIQTVAEFAVQEVNRTYDNDNSNL